MKPSELIGLVFLIGLILALSGGVTGQSGRKAAAPPPVPRVEEPPKTDTKPESAKAVSPATAEKDEYYVCTEDGPLAQVLDPDPAQEQVFTPKQVDTKATILSKPRPTYTRDARRIRAQGFVILRVVLSSAGKISRIRVLRGLPAGLTESGIRAACKIKFQPAMKDGQLVSQSIQVEYVFRLPDSSIFRP